MTLKYEFLEKFSLSLNEFAKHKDVTPGKVWTWIEDKIDSEVIRTQKRIAETDMMIYNKAIDDAIEICNRQYEIYVDNTKIPENYDVKENYEAMSVATITIRAKLEQLKEKK